MHKNSFSVYRRNLRRLLSFKKPLRSPLYMYDHKLRLRGLQEVYFIYMRPLLGILP